MTRKYTSDVTAVNIVLVSSCRTQKERERERERSLRYKEEEEEVSHRHRRGSIGANIFCIE